jgi:hypothetical protein
MAKALSSYPRELRKQIAARRAKGKTGGLGYLAAIDFENKVKTI